LSVRRFLAAVLISLTLSGCGSLSPTGRTEIEFEAGGSAAEIHAAARRAADRLGGGMIEVPLGDPILAGRSSIANRLFEQRTRSIGEIPSNGSTVPDTMMVQGIEGGRQRVRIRSIFPYLLGAATQEELAATPRNDPTLAIDTVPSGEMPIKSKPGFMLINAAFPALGELYLHDHNPYAVTSLVAPRVIWKLLVDAALIVALFTPSSGLPDDPVATARIVLGGLALINRADGALEQFREIDRYNMVARSGLHLSLESIEQFLGGASVRRLRDHE
jgi:hypothetical protein